MEAMLMKIVIYSRKVVAHAQFLFCDIFSEWKSYHKMKVLLTPFLLGPKDYRNCRLETTNCSVLKFSALRAATFIKEYIEIQKNTGRQVLKKLCAARGYAFLENK